MNCPKCNSPMTKTNRDRRKNTYLKTLRIAYGCMACGWSTGLCKDEVEAVAKLRAACFR